MLRASLGTVIVISVVALLATACRDAPVAATADPAPVAPTAPAAPVRASALHLGAPIETDVPKVALADLAKNPGAWSGKAFATEGTVTAVCQHMGCWMELRGDGDADGQAHVKMAGHHFFVPKTAAGHKARVLATLEGAPETAGSSPASCSDQGQATRRARAAPRPRRSSGIRCRSWSWWPTASS